MKNFYRIVEKGDVNDGTYDENKRLTVLETIKPICEAFGITDYDYIIDMPNGKERLIVEGQIIGCMCNSIGATVNELIIYIFIKSGAIDRICYFKEAVRNRLKCNWRER